MKMDEEKKEHKAGKPWTVTGKYHRYEEADARRSEIQESRNLDVKVRRWANGEAFLND